MIAVQMKTKFSRVVLSATVFALCSLAEAQQTTKIPRIGYLIGAAPSAVVARNEAFRHGLRDLGYVEGKNVVIEWRYAEAKLDRLPALAAELVRLKVDVIVAGGPTPTRAAKDATSTIPIVMAQHTDPVGGGLVASLARPGGNITGLSTLSPEISGKRLELLKEIFPKLVRVAVIGSSTSASSAHELRGVELAVGALGLKPQLLDIIEAKDVEIAFRAASKERAGAVLVLSSGIIANRQTEMTKLAIKNRLPVMYYRSEFVEAGGLMSYGVSFTDLDRRAATYVDKILKGAKPGDIPVEQPTKFELVINLKAAKQIGLTIPPNVLARADRVIK